MHGEIYSVDAIRRSRLIRSLHKYSNLGRASRLPPLCCHLINGKSEFYVRIARTPSVYFISRLIRLGREKFVRSLRIVRGTLNWKINDRSLVPGYRKIGEISPIIWRYIIWYSISCIIVGSVINKSVSTRVDPIVPLLTEMEVKQLISRSITSCV